MNYRLLIKLIIIGILITSCRPIQKQNTRKVTYYHYYLSWFPNVNDRDLKSKYDLYLDTILQNGRTKYIYHKSILGGDTLTLDYSINKDSLFYNDFYCKTIDTIQFNFKNKLIELYMSDYDEDSVYDEESHIYWNNNYGIIGIHNYSSGPFVVIEHDSIRNFATEDFYKFIVKKERDKSPPILD